jgi:tetratricopeptide (TPR) repeat protein
LVSQIGSLNKAGARRACAELGAAKIGETTPARSASTSDLAYYASTCAGAALAAGEAEAVNRALIGPLTGVLRDEGAHLSVDDLSDGWRIAREIHLTLGDEAAARQAAETQKAILDKAAAEAFSAYDAMTHNWPRAEVYVFLDRGAELVADLEKSAKALPEEYDPPYRLAWVLHKIGRSEDAKRHAARAVERVYGPRKARAMSLLADITEAAGDPEGARVIRERMVAHVESLPEGQRSDSLLSWAKKQLEPEAD